MPIEALKTDVRVIWLKRLPTEALRIDVRVIWFKQVPIEALKELMFVLYGLNRCRLKH